MVKAIADRQKVHSPGFFGFALKYSVPIMGPLLLLIWLLFSNGLDLMLSVSKSSKSLRFALPA